MGLVESVGPPALMACLMHVQIYAVYDRPAPGMYANARNGRELHRRHAIKAARSIVIFL